MINTISTKLVKEIEKLDKSFDRIYNLDFCELDEEDLQNLCECIEQYKMCIDEIENDIRGLVRKEEDTEQRRKPNNNNETLILF